MSDTHAELLAALWRLSHAEAGHVQARIALLERAVMRAMATTAARPAAAWPDTAWTDALAEAERAVDDAAARNERIAALLRGRAA